MIQIDMEMPTDCNVMYVLAVSQMCISLILAVA